MNVLSLFDGMSCGQIALDRLDIKPDNYFASEIDKHSITITQKNYPNTIQLGDVTQLDVTKLPKIDLLMGGSPCQNLSIAVIDRENIANGLNGQKSKLFYEYVRILKYLKPKYFLLENVASMTEKNKQIISEIIGVEPIRINSNLISAQDRDRYYWTNVPVSQLTDEGIMLKDIMETNAAEKYFYDKPLNFMVGIKK